MTIPQKDWVTHIIEEGSREHVVAYSMKRGAYCSESNCEYNKPYAEEHLVGDGKSPGEGEEERSVDQEDLFEEDRP